MSDLQTRIEALRPSAGDAIVVSVPGRLTDVQREHIRDACRAGLPSGVKVLVLDAGISLAHVAAPQPALAPTEVEVLGFDAWMRKRTNDAHAEFMKRTSRLLLCDWRATATTEDIARLFRIPADLEAP